MEPVPVPGAGSEPAYPRCPLTWGAASLHGLPGHQQDSPPFAAKRKKVPPGSSAKNIIPEAPDGCGPTVWRGPHALPRWDGRTSGVAPPDAGAVMSRGGPAAPAAMQGPSTAPGVH